MATTYDSSNVYKNQDVGANTIPGVPVNLTSTDLPASLVGSTYIPSSGVGGLGAGAGASAGPTTLTGGGTTTTGTQQTGQTTTTPQLPQNPLGNLASMFGMDPAIQNRQLNQQQQWLDYVQNTLLPSQQAAQTQLNQAQLTGQWDKIPTLQKTLQDANIALANFQTQINAQIAQSGMSGTYGGLPTLQAQQLMNQIALQAGDQGLNARGQDATALGTQAGLAQGLAQTQAQLAQSPLVAYYTARGLPPPQSSLLQGQAANLDTLEKKVAAGLNPYTPTQPAWNFSSQAGPLPQLPGAPTQVPGSPSPQASWTPPPDIESKVGDLWAVFGRNPTIDPYEALKSVFGTTISDDAMKNVAQQMALGWKNGVKMDQPGWMAKQIQAATQQTASPIVQNPGPGVPQTQPPATWAGQMPTPGFTDYGTPQPTQQLGGQASAMNAGVAAAANQNGATSGLTGAGFGANGQWSQPPGQTTIQGGTLPSDQGSPLGGANGQWTQPYGLSMFQGGSTPPSGFDDSGKWQGGDSGVNQAGVYSPQRPPMGGAIGRINSGITVGQYGVPTIDGLGNPLSGQQQQALAAQGPDFRAQGAGGMLRGGPIQQGQDQRMAMQAGGGSEGNYPMPQGQPAVPTNPTLPAMPGQVPLTTMTNVGGAQMSSGVAPWAASLANGYRMPANIGSNSMGIIPSASVWNGMSPTEQQAAIQVAASQGYSPSDFMAAMNANAPQWGARAPMQYRSSAA